MKKQLKIYKLHFTSPLHLSTQRADYGISQTTIPSDTIYAALTACLAKLGEKIPDNGDLGCTISSLFPFYQSKDGKAMYFLPRPLLSESPTAEIKEMKKIKKVVWLEVSAFNVMLAGDHPFESFEILGKYLIPKDNNFGFKNNKEDKKLTDSYKYTDFCHSQVSERVSITDRTMQSDAEPFYMDRVFFREKSGLYFIAEGNTELLDKAIKLLALEGIGTDRNVGNGFFEFESDTLDLELPDNANHILALSSFCPETKEQLDSMLYSDKATYELQRRGGWITTPPNQSLRKNVIYMFAAGSVLKHDANDICTFGKIVNLRPDIIKDEHPIWRCGKALFIPINV